MVVWRRRRLEEPDMGPTWSGEPEAMCRPRTMICIRRKIVWGPEGEGVFLLPPGARDCRTVCLHVHVRAPSTRHGLGHGRAKQGRMSSQPFSQPAGDRREKLWLTQLQSPWLGFPSFVPLIDKRSCRSLSVRRPSHHTGRIMTSIPRLHENVWAHVAWLRPGPRSNASSSIRPSTKPHDARIRAEDFFQ
ncbi:hypothetical protein BKA80DRAFT_45402 [Phyllosticta citrichinensis]